VQGEVVSTKVGLIMALQHSSADRDIGKQSISHQCEQYLCAAREITAVTPAVRIETHVDCAAGSMP
jgi:hypothetical protein